MNPFINYHVILVCLLIGFCGESFSIQPSQPVKASWISDVESIVPGESFVVGIVLTHPPHWHTYWVNPGTGYRTRITWTLPEGFSVTDIAWPTPKSFTLFGEPLFGYEGEVVFPFTVTPPDTIKPGTKVALQAKAEFLQCDDKICIPGQGDLSLILPVDRGHRPTPEAVQSRIRSSLDSLPKPMAFGVNARLVDNAFHMVFLVPLSGVGEARFFPSQVGVYDLSGFTPSRPFEGGVRFILPLTHGLESVPGRIQGVLAIQQPGKPYHGYAIDVVVGGG